MFQKRTNGSSLSPAEDGSGMVLPKGDGVVNAKKRSNGVAQAELQRLGEGNGMDAGRCGGDGKRARHVGVPHAPESARDRDMQCSEASQHRKQKVIGRAAEKRGASKHGDTDNTARVVRRSTRKRRAVQKPVVEEDTSQVG